ncbi:MAG: thioredoxin domain-containing protein [Gemmatimonadetes bacterium]|nr:thioredoxin domain-containing protein [Gemmatimonadota bacterium]
MNEKGSAGLAEARSPFLQHGVRQPVKWMPWGEAAFERARQENRAILLDIGAVWCHWCHVMDRESYEDAATARLINELFVPVKVDRDERPDVDARYQRAVQALTGQGGWPLTAFLTPEGEVFYGGTYFPPQDQLGRPAYRRVLEQVARVWREERERARESARSIRDRLLAHEQAEAQAGELSPALVDHAAEEFAESFDFRHGGFGRAPKFPNAGGLELLLDQWLDTGAEWARRVVVETLDAMGRGGIYDQLGGGFHRYSTDARWIVPHFEKMAYDNGVLLEVYSRAFAALGSPFHGEVGEGVVDHYRELAPALLEAGGFPASQDADIGPSDDGDYWTWTLEEVRAALDSDERRVRAAVLRYGLDEPASSMHLDPGRHVLYQALAEREVGLRLGLDEAEAEALLEDVRRRLKAARDQRPAPFVDQTLYSGWVSLVASGHLAAARYLGRGDAGTAALRALDRVWEEGFRAAEGIAHRLGDGEAGSFLDDQAYVARALVDAFELTQRPEHLERAEQVVQVMLRRFRDPESGALLDRPREERAAVPVIEEPHRPIADAPAPAGNAVAALTLLRLAALQQREEYRETAGQVLAAFAGSAPRMATAAATYFRALAWAVRPVSTLVLVGAAGEPAAEALWAAALRTYRPRTVVRRFEPGAVLAETVPPELRAMVTAEAPQAYLCVGKTCAPPASRPEELAELLRSFRG